MAERVQIFYPVLGQRQGQDRRRGHQLALGVQIIIAASLIADRLAHDLALAFDDVNFRGAGVTAAGEQEINARQNKCAQNRPADDVSPSPEHDRDGLFRDFVWNQLLSTYNGSVRRVVYKIGNGLSSHDKTDLRATITMTAMRIYNPRLIGVRGIMRGFVPNYGGFELIWIIC